MKSIDRQTGLTPISIILLLAIGAFFVLLALRLTPIYLENFKVSSHLEKLAHDPSSKTMSEDELINKLFKRFSIDDVEHVTQDNVTTELSDGDLMIYIDYEVRAPTFGNIDIVASFSEQAAIPR
jgi:hypothetical protein